MKKISKRLLSLILSLLMIVSVMPMSAITAQAGTIAELYWPVRDSKGNAMKSLSTHFMVNGWHHGIDVANSSGGKWYAAYDGIIDKVYTGCKTNGNGNHWNCNPNHGRYSFDGYYVCNNGFGNGVLIRCNIGGTTYYMQYAHMSSVASGLKEGQKITKGTYLGNVGDRGYSFGTHAHFEVNKGTPFTNYVNVDPYISGCAFSYNYGSIVTKPSAPKIVSNVSGDIAANSNVTVTWSGVSGASSYIVKVNGKQVQDNSSTKYAFTAGAQKYEITVSAKNSAGTSGTSNKITVTGHNPSTVTFKDYDGTVLNTQSVKYNASAVSPEKPLRDGYTFDGWDKSYSNIKSDTTVTATYKINTYTIKFVDKDGKVLSTQKVDYLNDAVEPEDKNVPTGYKFIGWNSADYENVKSDKTIQGIYAWSNNDLPIVASITSATRQDDGYYVYFDLTNYPDAVTRGRAIVSIKTSEGKLIDTTESSAFSIAKNGTKTGMEVFVPCEKAATQVELVIVNSYSSGVPISEVVTASIDQGKAWTDWGTEKPAEGTYDAMESRTEYKYRDKETTTGSNDTMDGWELYDTTWAWSDYGAWSSWSKTAVTASDSRKVETKTVTDKAAYTNYNYYYYRYWNSSANCYYYTYAANGTKYTKTLTSPMSYYATYDGHKAYVKSGGGYYNFSGEIWFLSSTSNVAAQTHKEYRYADRSKIYTYHFYRWLDWSDWSPEEVTATDSRDIQTRITYRYRSNDAGEEDTSGEIRTITGTVDSSLAGKQATIFIYKVDEASDYSNEYVAQTTIDENGQYSFTYKLREEPTVKTGDFTIALGIEGTTNTTIIGTIEAPKPVYTVNFYDYQGNVIDTQQITEGDNAVVPTLDEREGYTFTGWDDRTTNVKDNLDVHPEYTKNQYTVVFVNWETDSIDIKEFYYGDKLIVPDVEPKEGYNLTGWEGVEEGETIVTDNMIVTATYSKEVYEIKFLDFDGNVIETQNVEYGDAATAPQDLTGDDIIFLGWATDEFDDYSNVTKDMELIPQYVFEDTVETPTANIESGVYNDVITVSLNCDTPNSVIFYSLDGSDPNIMGNIYTGPITVSQSSQLRFIAGALNMNNSEEVSKYYCINNPEIASEWMPYSQLPQTVVNNFSDYTVESDTGYRYKDVEEAYTTEKAAELIANNWVYEESTYTDYTAWQDETITDDGSKPGFEIDTREVEDTTVTRYQYSHYKYTDSNGDVQYSPSDVDGYDCEYETIIVDNRLTIAGFDDNNVSFYTYNGEKWFTQTKVSGVKTQYRSRYQVDKYYKWTAWCVTAPDASESREYETDTVYRYYNKNHYIVTIPNLGDAGTTLIMRENDTIDISPYNDVTGYEFEGLYFDNEFTNKLDLSKPITESVTLYAKYTPNTYTVIFQMQDGTELDTQVVSYMQSATAPATDTVPGWVFNGWDKSFDCVLGDLVVTGSYLKESEYAYISFDKENLSLYQGTSITLIPVITPDNLIDEEIEWNSSNTSVATVDENGLVTAISAGTTTITAKVVKTNEIAECNITVAEDTNNFLVLTNNTSLNYDSLGYLRRISFETSTSDVAKEFSNKNSNLKFFNINGTELGADDNVGTGTQIKLFNGASLVDSKTVVITGDMTGDGIINNRD
ncbi:MAG: InlB B-repeat-containing protein, partial [Candidatus Gastranaerophilaceae bacterium]